MSDAKALAGEIVQLARTTLLTELRFLSPALCRMPAVEDPEIGGLATEGEALHFNTAYVLTRWMEERSEVLRGFLHVVLHCVYHHPFADSNLLPACWHLACDIAVEAVIEDLELPSMPSDPQAAETIHKLREKLQGRLTAERLYRYYCDSGLTESQLAQIRLPFERDEHDLWFSASSGEATDGQDGGDGEDKSGKAGKSGTSRQDNGEEKEGGGRPDGSNFGNETGMPQAVQAAAGEWRRIASQVKAELETHSHLWADKAGSMLLNIQEGQRSKRRYADFLRRFARLSEIPEPDTDSWDPMLYTYGMEMYGNMPIVEPLEFREQERIISLVIVLDTSGSVQGERIETFLTRTCELLLAENTYLRQTEIHILECDAKVHKDSCIRCAEELENFHPGQLHGGGGTDFRPAFDYIQRLCEEGHIRGLRGILYFTDGDGTYPTHPPKWETAFIFTDREDSDRKVPPWAIRVLLDGDSLNGPEILYYE